MSGNVDDIFGKDEFSEFSQAYKISWFALKMFEIIITGELNWKQAQKYLEDFSISTKRPRIQRLSCVLSHMPVYQRTFVGPICTPLLSLLKGLKSLPEIRMIVLRFLKSLSTHYKNYKYEKAAHYSKTVSCNRATVHIETLLEQISRKKMWGAGIGNLL